MQQRLNRINKAIRQYSEAYKILHDLQEEELKQYKNERFLPTGDQKTGVIGEFYVLHYLIKTKKENEVVSLCENHSEKGYDIVIKIDNEVIKQISVKTVSAYSKTRMTSPITLHEGLSNDAELHLLSLNEELLPNGYWVTTLCKDLIDKRIKIPISESPLLFGKRLDNQIENLNKL